MKIIHLVCLKLTLISIMKYLVTVKTSRNVAVYQWLLWLWTWILCEFYSESCGRISSKSKDIFMSCALLKKKKKKKTSDLCILHAFTSCITFHGVYFGSLTHLCVCIWYSHGLFKVNEREKINLQSRKSYMHL